MTNSDKELLLKVIAQRNKEITQRDEEISLLKRQVASLIDSYNKVVNTANEMNAVLTRAEALLDKVEAYTPAIATGEKMKASPGRKPKVSDEKLLSLHQEGKKNKEIAEETGLSEPTISVRLKKIMKEVR